MGGCVRLPIRCRSCRAAGTRRPRAAFDVGVHARPRDDLVGAGARPSSVPRGRRAACPPRAAPSGSGLHLVTRGEIGPGTGWLGRAQRLIEREDATASSRDICCFRRCSSARLPGTTRPLSSLRGEAAAIGERFGDADLFALGRSGAGHPAGQAGESRGRALAAGRGHGGRDRGGAVADRQRARLLRRDRRLSGARTSCVALRSGRPPWPGGASEQPDMVSLHGTLPGASCGDPGAARRLAGRAGGGAAGRGAVAQRAQGIRAAAARLSTGRASCIGCEGSFAAAEEAYRKASRGGSSRSRVSRSCDWLREATKRRAQRSGVFWARPRSARSARGCCLLASRSCSPSAMPRRRARGCRELAEIASGHESGMLGAMASHADGRAEPRRRRCRRSAGGSAPGLADLGGAGVHRTKLRACACSSAWPAARSETRTGRRSSWRAPAALRGAGRGARPRPPRVL